MIIPFSRKSRPGEGPAPIVYSWRHLICNPDGKYDTNHMNYNRENEITAEYTSFINARDFPCVAARAAFARQNVKCLLVDHMACPKDDLVILNFLYGFIDDYRKSGELFHSASIIFEGPTDIDEQLFDTLLWQRLQALSNLDGQRYDYDKRVNPDPASPSFSFSLKQEAFFIIGLHPASSRPGRKFKYPALAFNPHAQFEELRETNRYEKMKNIVRKRDLEFAGSVNPMLVDYGHSSEAFQYSGQVYDSSWQCPFKLKHESIENNSTP